MFPINRIFEIAGKINWKKVGEVAEKTAKIAATVFVAAEGAKKVMNKKTTHDGKIAKRIKRLDKMKKKGSITKQEYDTMRNKLIKNTTYKDI